MTVSHESMTTSEYKSAERILARLVALAFASDHPELFTTSIDDQSDAPILSSSELP
jgi:hypothetical protein